MITILSLGAGVQSTTLALMAAAGEFPGVTIDAAIFADTHSEPPAVYEHLERLERALPFPVYRVSVGSLREEILGAMRGDNRMDARPPFYTKGGGMLRRQCTQDFKIVPIMRKVRELAGIAKGSRGPKAVTVVQWIGISFDEALRMRDSRFRWLTHVYPLVERRMTRGDCLRWLKEHGHAAPPKSACTFCPFHSNATWREMRQHDPVAFADAVLVDQAIRPGMPGPKRPLGEEWFLHPQRVPLELAALGDDNQPDLFANECEGMCGV